MSKKRFRTGIIMFGFVVLFLAFDSVIHILDLPVVVSSFAMLGYSNNVAVPLGIIELICIILLLVPRTTIIGALLLTGYLGGAVASNLRIGAPLLSTVLFPVYIGILLWAGLCLLNTDISSLVLYRKK